MLGVVRGLGGGGTGARVLGGKGGNRGARAAVGSQGPRGVQRGSGFRRARWSSSSRTTCSSERLVLAQCTAGSTGSCIGTWRLAPSCGRRRRSCRAGWDRRAAKSSVSVDGPTYPQPPSLSSTGRKTTRRWGGSTLPCATCCCSGNTCSPSPGRCSPGLSLPAHLHYPHQRCLTRTLARIYGLDGVLVPPADSVMHFCRMPLHVWSDDDRMDRPKLINYKLWQWHALPSKSVG